ncbi:MAG: ABC-type multidrug transport system fused ATPase/permease subunit [Sulfurimonas sp.]|jgi:ABC-type multidrug transport system fused ATPase/permease subunit
MIKILKKEFTIYTALLTLLIILMHPDIISNPTIRLGLMQEKANYIHPLLYTFFIYLVLYFFRALIAFVLRLIKRGKNK